MPSRLSSLLVRDGLVPVTRMERAFQEQVLHDGSLDTVLLEMKAIAEERLVQYLSLATGLPPAGLGDLDKFDAEAVRACGQPVAEQYGVAPVRFDGQTLKVLVCDPVDLGRLEKLADELGAAIEPMVVPEYRFHLCFSHLYDRPPEKRFAALAEVNGEVPALPAVSTAKKVVLDTRSDSDDDDYQETKVVDVGIEATPRTTREFTTDALREHTAKSTPAAAPETATETAKPTAAEAPAADDATGPLEPARALELLGQADDRDQIFELLLRGIRHHARYACLLMIKGGKATGRFSLHQGELTNDDIESVEIPLDIESPYKRVATLGAPHIGPALSGNAVVDEMTKKMGGGMPKSTVLLPVALRGRVVAVAVGHSGSNAQWISNAPSLLPLAVAAADAISRLLAAKHKSAAGNG